MAIYPDGIRFNLSKAPVGRCKMVTTIGSKTDCSAVVIGIGTGKGCNHSRFGDKRKLVFVVDLAHVRPRFTDLNLFVDS